MNVTESNRHLLLTELRRMNVRMTEMELQVSSLQEDLVELSTLLQGLRADAADVTQIDTIKLTIAMLETQVQKILGKLT